MLFRVVVPILHSGQLLELGVTVDSEKAYGVRSKSPLPVSRLAARGHISPLAVATEPTPPPAPEPAPEPAAAPEPQPSKRKVVAL